MEAYEKIGFIKREHQIDENKKRTAGHRRILAFLLAAILTMLNIPMVSRTETITEKERKADIVVNLEKAVYKSEGMGIEVENMSDSVLICRTFERPLHGTEKQAEKQGIKAFEPGDKKGQRQQMRTGKWGLNNSPFSCFSSHQKSQPSSSSYSSHS